MRYIPAFILVVSLLLASCSGSKTASTGEIIKIDLLEAFKKEKPVKLSDFIKSVEFIPLESTKESYFRYPYSYKIGQKYVMVADGERAQVVLFDRTGKFIRTIGTKGKGPGELLEPREATMAPDEDFVYVADVGKSELLKYSIDGEFIKEISIKKILSNRYINGIRFINDKQFVLVNWRPYAPTGDFASLPVFDEDLKHISDIMPRANDENLVINVYPHGLFFYNPERMTFWEPYVDTLYTIKPSGEAIPTHVIGFSSGGPDRKFATTNINPNRSAANSVRSILDDGQYLHITGEKDRKWFTALYNHKTKEIFKVANTPTCDTTGYFNFGGLENDLWGVGTVSLSTYDKDIDSYIVWGRLERIASYYDHDCIRKKEVKYPKLRDRFLELAEDPEASVQEILIVMKRK
jgi:hypothetical protein